MNVANRMTKIRECLRDYQRRGNLGVIAAKANFGEGALRDWLENPSHSPSRDELTRIERALGLLAPDVLEHNNEVIDNL